MHKGAVGIERMERVRQVRQGKDESLRDFESYVPIGSVVAKLKEWRNQGAEIIYLSSHRNPKDVEKDSHVLIRYDFPRGPILFRKENETYGNVVDRALPDILIEDDCESIGGEAEMAYPQIGTRVKEKVKSIVVKEFSGIDYLPDDISALKEWHAS